MVPARPRGFTEVARRTTGLAFVDRSMLTGQCLPAKSLGPAFPAHGNGVSTALSASQPLLSRSRLRFRSHSPAALQAIGRPDRLKVVELRDGLRAGRQRHPRLL